MRECVQMVILTRDVGHPLCILTNPYWSLRCPRRRSTTRPSTDTEADGSGKIGKLTVSTGLGCPRQYRVFCELTALKNGISGTDKNLQFRRPPTHGAASRWQQVHSPRSVSRPNMPDMPGSAKCEVALCMTTLEMFLDKNVVRMICKSVWFR